MFKIGDFSKLSQVSVRMLRYYDELGLLKPVEVDRFTGYRFYSAAQLSRLNKITALRDMGFLALEISGILEDEISNEDMLLRLAEKKREIENTISCEGEKLKRIEKMIKFIKKESVDMNYEVKIKTVPSYKVISLREVIPAYDREGMLWARLGEFVEKQKISCTSDGFAIYHDQEHREADVDVEVVMPVNELQKDMDGFRFRETEAVLSMASLMVAGPFGNIAPAYHSLAEWLENNDYNMVGTARQVCHRGPWNESSPENYLTEIQMPVEKK